MQPQTCRQALAEPPPRAAAGDRRDPPGSRQWDYNFAGRSIKIEVPAFECD